MEQLGENAGAKERCRLRIQQDVAKDYVIATGLQYSVRDFIAWSARALGIELKFVGDGLNETAVVVAVDKENAPTGCLRAKEVSETLDSIAFAYLLVFKICAPALGEPVDVKPSAESTLLLSICVIDALTTTDPTKSLP